MQNVSKILLVEDEKILREALSERLSAFKEFSVEQADCGQDALAKIGQENFDIIILDIGLPDIDGRTLCQEMRTANITTPIIMLTGHSEENDIISGLDLGANDYITKPFRLNILLARIRTQLRQHKQSEHATFQIGHYMFKPALKKLETKDGITIRLTEKETNILKFLYRAENKIVSRETLLHEIWGYNKNITTHTLETHIYRLRQKMETNASSTRILLTESHGYRLIS